MFCLYRAPRIQEFQVMFWAPHGNVTLQNMGGFHWRVMLIARDLKPFIYSSFTRSRGLELRDERRMGTFPVEEKSGSFTVVPGCRAELDTMGRSLFS